MNQQPQGPSKPLTVFAVALCFLYLALDSGAILGPAPIPEYGIRCMIVYDTEPAAMAKMQQDYPGQFEILNSTGPGSVREWLNAHCIQESHGSAKSEPAYRLLDKDQPDGLKFDDPIWQRAWQRPRTSLPWIIASNGRTGFEGPLPNDPQALIRMLNQLN